MSSRTFELLWYLAEHPLQVISKDQLMAALWPDSFVEEGNLTQQIFLLRKALASAGMEESLVVTVPGKGYQFAVTVEASEAVEHSETEQISPPSDFQGSAALSTLDGELHMHAVQSVTRVVIEEETEDELPAMRSLPEPRAWPKRRLWLTAVGALAVLAAGSFLGWRYLHKAPANGIDLVLSDFENRTGDPDFDHTLNQALLIDLEQTPYFHLLSRSRIQETLAEMQRKPDEVLTTPVAAEVCERNNALVMLHGQIFRVGGKYLLILNAESCVTGKQVAGYKAEASSKEEVLAALDKAAARVRRQLGESAASLDRYKIPIAQATTASLPALRAYSEAIDSFASGDRKAAQVQLERAVSFDPAFASAYRLLGSSYYNLFDFSEAAVYYKKAFDLRDRTTERERLGIEIMYYGYALNNYEESIRRIRQFLQVYPEDAESWVALSDQLTELGQYSQAIQAAEQAHRLEPGSGVARVELARAYLRSNRFADAKQVAKQALADGKEHSELHSILFQIAFAEHDAVSQQAEGEWGLTHGHVSASLRELAMAAFSGGKVREGERYFERARAAALHDGDMEAADGLLLDQCSILIELEEIEKASRLFGQRNPKLEDPEDIAFLQALLGQLSQAESLLASSKTKPEDDTIKLFITRPILLAVVALRAGRPAEAIQALEPARPYQLRDYSVLYWRAEAETQVGALEAAARDYRMIIDNAGVNPVSPEYALAHLRMAHVLSLQKQRTAALSEFKAFFNAWQEADPDQPLILHARQEYAEILQGTGLSASR